MDLADHMAVDMLVCGEVDKVLCCEVAFARSLLCPSTLDEPTDCLEHKQCASSPCATLVPDLSVGRCRFTVTAPATKQQ